MTTIEEDQFRKIISEFQNKNLNNIPNGLSLLKLYKTVQDKGGFQNIKNFKELEIEFSNKDIKKIYEEYLLEYEKKGKKNFHKKRKLFKTTEIEKIREIECLIDLNQIEKNDFILNIFLSRPSFYLKYIDKSEEFLIQQVLNYPIQSEDEIFNIFNRRDRILENNCFKSLNLLLIYSREFKKLKYSDLIDSFIEILKFKNEEWKDIIIEILINIGPQIYLKNEYLFKEIEKNLNLETIEIFNSLFKLENLSFYEKLNDKTIDYFISLIHDQQDIFTRESILYLILNLTKHSLFFKKKFSNLKFLLNSLQFLEVSNDSFSQEILCLILLNLIHSFDKEILYLYESKLIVLTMKSNSKISNLLSIFMYHFKENQKNLIE